MSGNEEAHAAYEAAVAKVRADLGRTHRIEIGGTAIGGAAFGGAVEAPLIDRSPIDPSLIVGRFPAATSHDVGRAGERARHALTEWSGRPWRQRLAVPRPAAPPPPARPP